MKLAFLCTRGHLTIAHKESSLRGSTAPVIACPYCMHDHKEIWPANRVQDMVLEEDTNAVVEFFKPTIVSDLNLDEINTLNKGGLLIRTYRSAFHEKQMNAIQMLKKIAEFMQTHVPLEERLPSIADTCIRDLDEYYKQKKIFESMKPSDKNLN